MESRKVAWPQDPTDLWRVTVPEELSHLARLANPPFVNRWHLERDRVFKDSRLSAMPPNPRSVMLVVSYKHSSCRFVSFPSPFSKPLSVTFVTIPKLSILSWGRPANPIDDHAMSFVNPYHHFRQKMGRFCMLESSI